MKVMMFLVMALLLAPVFAAPVATYDFASEEQEALFNKLSNELRCLVCQNQAIADSNADLAKDLRDEIYGMLQQGKSEEEIVEFMVARYGDFVLYNPPLKPMTWLLWFGPVFALLAGFFFVVRIINRQKKTAAAEMSSEEIERLKTLRSEVQTMVKAEGGKDK
jgi:cytochrome c-type biogenesis protein CcmH